MNPEAFYGTEPISISARRRRRAQLVADVVQSDRRPRVHSDIDLQQLHLCRGAVLQSATRQNDRHGSSDADRHADLLHLAIGPGAAGGTAGRAGRVGSSRSADALAACQAAAAIGGGTLTTAGNLVFQTINDGRLIAYSADRARSCWKSRPVCAAAWSPPMTYRIAGRQHDLAHGRSRHSGHVRERRAGKYRNTVLA